MKKNLILGSFVAWSTIVNSQINQNPAGQTGFGTSVPANRLEIKTNTGDPYHANIATSGASGLRFTHLNSLKTPLATNGKVLSVDANGDVILVPDISGGSGGSVSGAQNGCSLNGSRIELGDPFPGGLLSQFLTDRRVHQNNNRIIFSGDSQNDLFQIGGNTFSGGARFYVENHMFHGGNYAEAIRCFADADNTVTNIGFSGHVADKIGSGSPAASNIGMKLLVTGTGFTKGDDITVISNNASNNLTYGTYITATQSNASSTGLVHGANITGSGNLNTPNAVGVNGVASGALNNYGGVFGVWGGQPHYLKSIGVQGSAGHNPILNIGGDFNGHAGSGQNISINSTNYGVRAIGDNGTINIGGNFTGRSALGANKPTNYGVQAEARGDFGSDNYGVYSIAKGTNSNSGALTNYGGYFVAGEVSSQDPSNANYGIWAKAYGLPKSSGGITYAGWFEGDIMVVGTPYATAAGPFVASDRRFKKDVLQIKDAIDQLKRVKGYTYKFKVDEYKDKNFSSEQQIGVIAQELKEVFPSLVSENGGYNYVNYQGLIPVLIEAIKEQQNQIENQHVQIDELRQTMENARQSSSTSLISNSGIIDFEMLQNEPNPFTHETVVKYTLPQSVSNAFMAVYDLTGKQITTFPIQPKGNSSIAITSEQLSAGIYIYSIVADGKVLDSKRMIVADK